MTIAAGILSGNCY